MEAFSKVIFTNLIPLIKSDILEFVLFANA